MVYIYSIPSLCYVIVLGKVSKLFEIGSSSVLTEDPRTLIFDNWVLKNEKFVLLFRLPGYSSRNWYNSSKTPGFRAFFSTVWSTYYIFSWKERTVLRPLCDVSISFYGRDIYAPWTTARERRIQMYTMHSTNCLYTNSPFSCMVKRHQQWIVTHSWNVFYFKKIFKNKK